jgi:hypothetical protein
MSGLFDGDRAKDVEAVLYLANQVAAIWNECGGQQHGFSVIVGEKELGICCDHAREILVESGKFPNPPGPFKRVAALIVCARLYPFFGLDPKPLTVQDRNAWLTRLVALLIPVTLQRLEVNVSKGEKEHWIALDKWIGFCSHHHKIEFLAFLEWLETCEWAQAHIPDPDWKVFNMKRLARMILATTLIIEANYYCGERPVSDDSLRKSYKPWSKTSNLTPLNYDGALFVEAKRKGLI